MMVQDPLAVLALQGVFSLLGFAAHVLKSMKQVGSGWDMSVMGYLHKYPKQTSFAAISMIGALVGFYEMGQLNYSTAFFCGYAANSLADTIAGRVIKQVR